MTLAAAVSNQHDIEILDLRSLQAPADWRQEIGPEYMEPIRYAQSTLTRHLIGNYGERIAQHPADVFVFTANFTSEANAVAQTIRTTKVKWPEALILVGGSDASPQERHEFYFTAGADYIGVGDGDTALPAFLESIQKSRSQPSRLIGGGIMGAFHLPLPNLSFVDQSRYKESGGGPILPAVFSNGGFAAYTEISRGCSRECAFCSARKTKLLVPPISDVLRHLDHLIDNGCRLLMFSDDNLLLAQRPDELLRIFAHLRERQVAWEFPNGLEVGLLADNDGNFREDLFEALFWNSKNPSKFAGAHRLLVPIEDALLHKSGLSKLKRVQAAYIGELLQRLINTGIPFLNLAIMIGGAQETQADREQLEGQLGLIFGLTRSTATRVNFSIFCTSPLPGTPLGKEITAQGRLSHSIEEAPELWTVFASVINGDNFTAEQTTNYRRELLQRFHMSQDEGKILPPS